MKWDKIVTMKDEIVKKISIFYKTHLSRRHCIKCQIYLKAIKHNQQTYEDLKEKETFYFDNFEYSTGMLEISYNNIQTISKKLKSFQADLMRKMNKNKDFNCVANIYVEWPMVIPNEDKTDYTALEYER